MSDALGALGALNAPDVMGARDALDVSDRKQAPGRSRNRSGCTDAASLVTMAKSVMIHFQ